ncbi:hypothetical protein DSO57_1027665 [Entomophthora muscae]|uniref:Uncharacterized protein n=1 Tax=Entomophthora muscae TaxID=34485 RepID=A0ACC2UMB1_9FUNG|nr:hypothetical protein DSO57_1027665 [Entomophthora muscae]
MNYIIFTAFLTAYLGLGGHQPTNAQFGPEPQGLKGILYNEPTYLKSMGLNPWTPLASSCPTPTLATYVIPAATLLYLAISLRQCNILTKAFCQAVNFYPIVYGLNGFEPPNLPSYVTKVLPSILGYYILCKGLSMNQENAGPSQTRQTQEPTPNRTGMTPKELQQHYCKGLCFHYHKAGHLTRACLKKNTAPVSLAQINTSSQSYKFIQVTIELLGNKLQIEAFIDTGADESFIDAGLAKELGMTASERSLQVVIGNSSLDTGYECEQELLLTIGHNLYPLSLILLPRLPHPPYTGQLLA